MAQTQQDKAAGSLFINPMWLLMAAPYIVISEMFPAGIAWPTGLWELESPYWGFILVCIACMAIFRTARAQDSRRLLIADTASGILMVVAVATVVPGFLDFSPLLVFLTMTLGGAGAAWQFVRWGQCLAHIPLRQAVGHVCLSMALSGLVKALYYFSMPQLETIVDVSLVVASVAALRSCLMATALPGNGKTAEKRREFQLNDLLPLIAASIVIIGLMGVIPAGRFITFGASGGIQVFWGELLETAAAVGVWVWVCLFKRQLSIIGITSAMVVAVISGTMLLAVLGGEASSFAFFLTHANRSLFILFTWIVLADLSVKTDRDSRYVSAAGWAVTSAPFLLGGCLAKAINLTLDSAVCAVLMYLASMALIFVLAGRNVTTSKIFSGLTAETPLNRNDLAQRCGELASAYHLTARESEVLELLAGGRTRPFIAEALDISENTVRVYTTKIYNKLDIHDRSSLFKMVYETPGLPTE